MTSTGKIGEIPVDFQETERAGAQGAKRIESGLSLYEANPFSKAPRFTNKDPGCLNELIASFQRTARFALNL